MAPKLPIVQPQKAPTATNREKETLTSCDNNCAPKKKKEPTENQLLMDARKKDRKTQKVTKKITEAYRVRKMKTIPKAPLKRWIKAMLTGGFETCAPLLLHSNDDRKWRVSQSALKIIGATLEQELMKTMEWVAGNAQFSGRNTAMLKDLARWQLENKAYAPNGREEFNLLHELKFTPC
jgi:histone H3/H4